MEIIGDSRPSENPTSVYYVAFTVEPFSTQLADKINSHGDFFPLQYHSGRLICELGVGKAMVIFSILKFVNRLKRGFFAISS